MPVSQGIVQTVGIVDMSVGEDAVIGRIEAVILAFEQVFVFTADPLGLGIAFGSQKAFTAVEDRCTHVLDDGQVIEGFSHMAAAEKHEMGFHRKLLDKVRI